jgi:hypothetical protein
MYCSTRLSWRDSAFSPFRAPGGGISQSSTCALNTNLIVEIGSNNKVSNLSVSPKFLTYPCEKKIAISTVFKYPHPFYAPGDDVVEGFSSINRALRGMPGPYHISDEIVTYNIKGAP